jgi:hypothetical protein
MSLRVENLGSGGRAIVTLGIPGKLPDSHPQVTRDFAAAIERQLHSLRCHAFEGTWLAWQTDLPGGSPSHVEAPFGFKPFCFMEAVRRGYTTVLWMDAAVVPVASLDPLFRQIEERGFLFFEEDHSVGEFCSDAALHTLGLKREMSFELRSCWACVIGLDLNQSLPRRFLEEWARLAMDGKTFAGPKWSGVKGFPLTASDNPRVKGHRHDQTVASVLAHRLGLTPWWTKLEFARVFHNDRRSTYIYSQRLKLNEDVCLEKQKHACARALTFEALIFSWRGQEKYADTLQEKLAPVLPTRVINSGSSKKSGWLTMPADSYFSAQWNYALKCAQAEVIIHVQADAACADWEEVVARVRNTMIDGNIGIYEPHVDFCELQYEVTKLRPIYPGVFEVPITDCTCWALHRDVYSVFPEIDVGVNRYGWGVPAVAAAIAEKQGMRVVRDYGISILHPRGRGYSTSVARAQRHSYLEHLEPQLREVAERRMREATRLHASII